MASIIHDFINNDFIPRLYQNLDVAFPDMQFSRRGNKWCSPYKKDGTNPKTPNKEKTVIKEKTPHLVFEGGEKPEEIVKWITWKYNYNSPRDAVSSISEKIGLVAPSFESKEYIEYQSKIETYLEAADEMRKALFTSEAEPILTQLTKGRGYTIDEIKEMGLGYINEDIARKYRSLLFIPNGVEHFHQIVIPYISEGKIEGFKFRKTSEKANAKYINSIFKKSLVLFGLSAIPQSGVDKSIILVDGELKALYMKVKGLSNVVSGAGSGSDIISDEQAKQAKKKGVKHVIIIADNESTAKERENEVNKIIKTLQKLNNLGINGYVVYLPHEDDTKKEDVEDFLQNHSSEELKQYIENAENGSSFRARIICEKYLNSQGENGKLTDKQTNDLYAEIFTLMAEHQGIDLAFIENVVKSYLGDSSSEWIDVVKRGADAIKRKNQAEKKNALVKKMSADIAESVSKGDVETALHIASKASQILQEESLGNFTQSFLPRKWDDITSRLKSKKIGIETLYKLRRGSESDILTLPNGGLTIIAAPTNHGKSTMLQNLALQTAQDTQNEGTVLYLTFEEDVESVSVQFLSKLIGKPISKDNKRSIKSYYRGEQRFINDIDAFNNGESKMKNLIEKGKLWINGTETENGISVDVLSNLIRLINQATENFKGGVSAVFIDYIQLIQPDERIKNRAEELKVICTQLKNTAVKLGLPIILAAQFSRDGSKSPYELESESLGEGGDIERAAAVIIGLWNTSKKPRQNSKFPEGDKIWKDPNKLQINFDPNNPKIYLRLLKSRGEATGGEALLDCDLNVGIIKPNTSKNEIQRLKTENVSHEEKILKIPF